MIDKGFAGSVRKMDHIFPIPSSTHPAFNPENVLRKSTDTIHERLTAIRRVFMFNGSSMNLFRARSNDALVIGFEVVTGSVNDYLYHRL